MRFATDTGGTFSDLIVEDDDGALRMYKAATVPSDPVRGVLDALALAATDAGQPLADFLARGEMFIHGTTHAINAIVTGRTARTALLTTAGHRDVLVLREAGRQEPFNHTVAYPAPYVPRRRTHEIRERIDSGGRIHLPLHDEDVHHAIGRLQADGIEAVGVCFLWSILNPEHELRVGELLRTHLPDVAVTLSHQLNPTIREYPRAVSTCIDASLKPLMARYLGALEERLRAAGFAGRVLVLTSQAGMLDADRLAQTPILAINSGPSIAPVAGRHYAASECTLPDVIVADTGGTTYDVSLVRGGHIPFTKESWLGQAFRSDMTGFPSVDVRSVGAGGGSIAWIDGGGVLHVGPDSAGADPGPACYAKGGTAPTLTDACVVLGYIDPEYFLGGSMRIDADLARAAVDSIARTLGTDRERAASAILEVATENMVQAIADITINRGVDPAAACLIGGGGAAGLNSVQIARRLGCPLLVIPATGAALSAAGALMTEVGAEFRRMAFGTSERLDTGAVTDVLRQLEGECLAFADACGATAATRTVEFAVEARYPSQVWEIELPVQAPAIGAPGAIERLVADFHALHERIYAIADPGSGVEFVTWIGKVRCAVAPAARALHPAAAAADADARRRRAYFPGSGLLDTDALSADSLRAGERFRGPAIVESPFTTVVIPPGAEFHLSARRNLVIRP